MAYNMTIDNSSPLIRYSPTGAWDDNVQEDVNLPNFFKQSYHFSISSSSTASLTFTGTGAWVFGSRRSISGTYSILIDSQPLLTLAEPLPANAPPQYQAVLGGTRGLEWGEHTIEIVNTSDGSRPVLDIDAFMIEAIPPTSTAATRPIGIDDANLSSTTGSNPHSISYSANQWSTITNQQAFILGTAHETTTRGATVDFQFVGDGFCIFGATGPQQGQYGVSIDGGVEQTLDANAVLNVASSSLFFTSGLGEGQHTARIRNLSGSRLTIDSFEVFSAGNIAAVNQPGAGAGNDAALPPRLDADNTAPPRSSPQTSGSNTPANLPLIIGASVGGFVFLMIIAGVILFFLRRRSRGLNSSSRPPKSNFDSGNNGNMLAIPTAGPLSRTESRASAATVVDLEAQQKQGGFGWFGGNGGKGKNDEPGTPPLPMQEAPAPSPIDAPARRAVGFGGDNGVTTTTEGGMLGVRMPEPLFTKPALPSPLSRPAPPPMNAPPPPPPPAQPIILGMPTPPTRGRVMSVASNYSRYSIGDNIRGDDDYDNSFVGGFAGAAPAPGAVGVGRQKSSGKYTTGYEVMRSRSRGGNERSLERRGGISEERSPPPPLPVSTVPAGIDDYEYVDYEEYERGRRGNNNAKSTTLSVMGFGGGNDRIPRESRMSFDLSAYLDSPDGARSGGGGNVGGLAGLATREPGVTESVYAPTTTALPSVAPVLHPMTRGNAGPSGMSGTRSRSQSRVRGKI